MTRYFYRSPLHAAVMAQDFGMKFSEPSGDHVALSDDSRDTLRQLCMEGWGMQGGKNYIHPDSLPLLEPQQADILVNSDDQPCQVDDEFALSPGGRPLFVTQGEASLALKRGGAEIIQRNGLPFYWPEQESE